MPYDVVIVGGGSAGCTLATRLSEDPDRSGTCKMSPSTDTMAVVDQYCRVHGIEALRVVAEQPTVHSGFKTLTFAIILWLTSCSSLDRKIFDISTHVGNIKTILHGGADGELRSSGFLKPVGRMKPPEFCGSAERGEGEAFFSIASPRG